MNEQPSQPKPATNFGIFCWYLFDWAHSAFPTVVITFVFGTYFLRSVVGSTVLGTAYWGWTMGISGIIVAIFSPILGSIADYTGRRKPWIGIFTLITIICTALLFFIRPNPYWIFWAISLVAIANTCYEYTQIFYNGMMTSIAPKNKIGRVSGWGWSLGYFGGLICLFIAMKGFVNSSWLTTNESINVRSTNLLVSVWFLLFAIPLFLFTPDLKKTGISMGKACRKGLGELWHTTKNIREYKGIFIFLIAHLIYIDGLNTLFIFGGIFAAGTFHMTYTQILYFAILLNVTAGIGAGIFAFVDDYVGPKFTISVSLIFMIVTGMIILSLHHLTLFWILSAILGIFVGPTQAASRSYMARIAPKHLTNQMFGIYQLSGNITSFIGPILVALFTEYFHNQRLGMVVIFLMMLIGLIVLAFAPKPDVEKKVKL